MAAGVVATLPGGLAASRAILTAGNVATDIVSGNLPNISNFGDAAEYAGGTLLDAWSTTSSAKSLGKLAELGLKPLAKQVGKEVLGEGAYSLINDAELAEMTLQWYGETIGTGVRVEITTKAIDWGSRAATTIMFSGVNTALGVHGNSKGSIDDLISKNNGKSRVTLRSEKTQFEIDLKGKEHYDKYSGETFETPHTKTSPRNYNAPNQPQYNTSGRNAKYSRTSAKELRWVKKFLKSR